MKKPILAFFLITVLMFSTPVGAEIYKYVDENGQKRWTDDLSQVPKDQRPSAQRLDTVEETPTDTAVEQTGDAQMDVPSASEPGSQDSDQTDETAGEAAGLDRESLEKEKAALDTQYQELLEERKKLEEMNTEALSADARSDLNKRISAYNAKTEQYETQLNAFNEKINAYNQQIMSNQSPKDE